VLAGYILVHMDVPVIDSLKIRAVFSSRGVELFLNYFFSDGLLPGRLFSNPPVFETRPNHGYVIYKSLKVRIGSILIQFDFDMEEEEDM